MTTAAILAALASAILFWPKSFDPIQTVKGFITSDGDECDKKCCSTGSSAPTFIQATECLASVKKRLNATETLEEEQKEAINILQLALTNGSEE